MLVGAASQPAQPTTWSGWSFLNLLSSSTILSSPRRVVDRLSVRSGEGGDDVAGAVTAVGLVAQHRGLDRLAAVVVEAALRDVLAQADSEDAAAEGTEPP